MICPECFYEWNPAEKEAMTETSFHVKDANGNLLQDGDFVAVIKELPLKAAPELVKAGTKVKNIRLSEDDHNIDSKIEDFGAMRLKSEYVKKA